MTTLTERVPEVAVRWAARVTVLVCGLAVGLAGAELVQAQILTRGLPGQVLVRYALAIAAYLLLGLAGLAALLALTLAPAGLRVLDGARILGAAVAADASFLVALYVLGGVRSSTTLEYLAMAVAGLLLAVVAARPRVPGLAP